MIPNDNEIYGTYLMSPAFTTATNEQLNMYRNDSDSRWVCCAEQHDNNHQQHRHQLDADCHFSTSRTDKPRLAHEIYGQWLAIWSHNNNDQLSGNLTYPLPFNRNDLLVAAYAGSNLMYRK